jgi:hypothetical protein
MYPHVTQFETQDRLNREELRRLREERQTARPEPRMRRAPVLALWLARMLKFG